MDFQLMLGPAHTATLIDNSTHWLRSAVLFKWSRAELALFGVRKFLVETPPKVRSADLTKDIEALWKARKSTSLRRYREELSAVRSAYQALKEDRHTLVHGRVEVADWSHTVVHNDPSTHTQSFLGNEPGSVEMVRHGHRIPQTAVALRPIAAKAEALLLAIRKLEVALDPTFVIEGRLQISEDSAPEFHFGEGRRAIEIKNKVNMSQVLQTEEVNDYRCATCGWMCKANPSQLPECCGSPMIAFAWKACPECSQAAIENGSACWHMRLAQYFGEGGDLQHEFTFPKFMRQLLSQFSDGLHEDDSLHITYSLDGGQQQVRCHILRPRG